MDFHSWSEAALHHALHGDFLHLPRASLRKLAGRIGRPNWSLDVKAIPSLGPFRLLASAALKSIP